MMIPNLPLATIFPFFFYLFLRSFRRATVRPSFSFTPFPFSPNFISNSSSGESPFFCFGVVLWLGGFFLGSRTSTGPLHRGADARPPPPRDLAWNSGFSYRVPNSFHRFLPSCFFNPQTSSLHASLPHPPFRLMRNSPIRARCPRLFKFLRF